MPRYSYKVNQKVLILKNERQPWLVGKVGQIADLIDKPHPWDYCGDEPYYYIFVDRSLRSSNSSSGCVLPESAISIKR